MLRNFLTIALRRLWTQKGITAINVLGLAAGLAVCLLVGLLLWDQVTNDDFHPGADRLYRATMTQHHSTERFATSPAGLAPVLRTEVTGVEAATRLRCSAENVVLDNQGYAAQALYADSSFFDVFGFELTAGSEEKALRAPFTAVTTQDLARTLYGDADPMGKTFQLPSMGTFTVTEVVNRDAYRSHLAFDVLYSFATLQQERADGIAEDWQWGNSHYTYLRLEAGRTPESLAPSLRQIEQQYLPPPDSVEGTPPERFGLQAVSALPLSSPLMNELRGGGMLPATVGYFLAALAMLVLLAAGRPSRRGQGPGDRRAHADVPEYARPRRDRHAVDVQHRAASDRQLAGARRPGPPDWGGGGACPYGRGRHLPLGQSARAGGHRRNRGRPGEARPDH